MIATFLLALSVSASDKETGNITRTIEVDGRTRSYILHVPKSLDRSRPAPVVLAFHGAAATAQAMMHYTGMNAKADEAGFVVVYPDSLRAGLVKAFNAGGVLGGVAVNSLPDDVRYTSALIDDVATQVKVDKKRVYATGISNGGMMCYRLAARLSDRIAAIAPVAGAMTDGDDPPGRPVPILHIHGAADVVVPWKGPNEITPKFVRFRSVPETIDQWVTWNKCRPEPKEGALPDRRRDGTRVKTSQYTAAAGGAPITVLRIIGGGHTWPGAKLGLGGLMGRTCYDIKANDVMWEFFKVHQLP